MIDLQIIACRMLELDEQEMCQAKAFDTATREEAERIGADVGEVRVEMLNWIRDHAVYTSSGGWSLKPALAKLKGA